MIKFTHTLKKSTVKSLKTEIESLIQNPPEKITIGLVSNILSRSMGFENHNKLLEGIKDQESSAGDEKLFDQFNSILEDLSDYIFRDSNLDPREFRSVFVYAIYEMMNKAWMSLRLHKCLNSRRVNTSSDSILMMKGLFFSDILSSVDLQSERNNDEFILNASNHEGFAEIKELVFNTLRDADEHLFCEGLPVCAAKIVDEFLEEKDLSFIDDLPKHNNDVYVYNVLSLSLKIISGLLGYQAIHLEAVARGVILYRSEEIEAWFACHECDEEGESKESEESSEINQATQPNQIIH